MNQPFVTIIMPIHNEEKFIGASLGAVLAQDYPADLMEIIVADGKSTDNTRQIVQRLQTQHPNLYLVDNPAQIASSGLNAALRRSTGSIIIRVDGHTEIAPDYVRCCVTGLQHTQADNVGGKMKPAMVEGFGQLVALATSSPFGVGGARFHYSDQKEWVDTVYMGAWPRRIFEQIGWFDEEMVRNQDDEFNYRLRKAGGRILLSPEIQSSYTPRSTPNALGRQYFQYGFWKVRVLQKHPYQMRPRQFVPLTFVVALLGAVLLALFQPGGQWVLGLIGGAYLTATLAASTWIGYRRDGSTLIRLPLVFAILHFSYGLGFLLGLIWFWKRWGDTSPYLNAAPAIPKRAKFEPSDS